MPFGFNTHGGRSNFGEILKFGEKLIVLRPELFG